MNMVRSFCLPSFLPRAAWLLAAVLCVLVSRDQPPPDGRRGGVLLWPGLGALMLNVARRSGPLVRIGPNDLVTNDADVLRRLWGVRSSYRKGPFYEAVRFDPTKDNLISMRDDEAHNTLRAKMAAGVCRFPV
jgi:hypothetical protein